MELRDQLQRSLGNTYTLERELSGGGMSRVFVADEPTLGRKIVVKVLPPDTAATVSLERFKREIQVAARLQHPHIVPLLSAGETDGLPYYTMPFVKGESLRTRLSRGGELSVNEAVHILHDVAAALAYAHGEGVVHRDIKPDNVIVSGGVAVVTDFGVAKAMDLAASDGGAPVSGITSMGIALGTPAYMAPEQASADPHVDHRADIYAFGCLAYEMLAGSSPFAGRPLQQMLAAHVTETPEPIAKRRPNLPPLLADLVMKCLEKRPGDRPQSAAELLTMLDAIATPSGGLMPTQVKPASRISRPMIVALALVALAIVVGVPLLFRRAPKPYVIGSTAAVAATPATEINCAISPDGKMVAYSARTAKGYRVFVRQIEGGHPVMLTDEMPGDYFMPSWTPDGSKVLFLTNDGAYLVPALGGQARKLLESTELIQGAAFSPDGKQVAYSAGALWVKPLDGVARQVASAGITPAWSPDGKRLAYVVGLRSYLGNTSASAVAVVSASGGTPVRVTDDVHMHASPVWGADGRSVLYVSDLGGTPDIYQQPLASNGSAHGDPIRLTTGLSTLDISLSADGKRLAYDVVHVSSNLYAATPKPGAPAQLANARQITTETQIIEGMALSHDGKWLAYDSNRNGNFDIFKIPVAGGDPTQLTSNPANEFQPSWSPDDREIAFHSPRGGPRNIFIISADGTNEQQVTKDTIDDFYPTFSRDGRTLLFTRSTIDSAVIQVITRGADGKWSVPRSLLAHPTYDYAATRYSPDGRQFAYVTHGVWVADSNGKNAHRIGGADLDVQRAEWAPDGQSLYITENLPDGREAISQLPLTGGPAKPVVVGDSLTRFYRHDLATDGKTFYFARARIDADVWVADLKP